MKSSSAESPDASPRGASPAETIQGCPCGLFLDALFCLRYLRGHRTAAEAAASS